MVSRFYTKVIGAKFYDGAFTLSVRLRIWSLKNTSPAISRFLLMDIS